MDFFHHLKDFLQHVTCLGTDQVACLEEDIQVAQVDYNSISMAYMRFKEMFLLLFKPVPSKPVREDELWALDFYRFAWTLFLYSKGTLTPAVL